MSRFPNYERSLTGRARVRCGWFGRMVLQVEVSELRYSACPPMPGSDPQEWRQMMRAKGETFLSWRDARWSDVHALPGLVGGIGGSEAAVLEERERCARVVERTVEDGSANGNQRIAAAVRQRPP